MGFLDALLRGATVVISQVWQGTRAVVRDLLREIDTSQIGKAVTRFVDGAADRLQSRARELAEEEKELAAKFVQDRRRSSADEDQLREIEAERAGLREQMEAAHAAKSVEEFKAKADHLDVHEADDDAISSSVGIMAHKVCPKCGGMMRIRQGATDDYNKVKFWWQCTLNPFHCPTIKLDPFKDRVNVVRPENPDLDTAKPIRHQIWTTPQTLQITHSRLRNHLGDEDEQVVCPIHLTPMKLLPVASRTGLLLDSYAYICMGVDPSGRACQHQVKVEKMSQVAATLKLTEGKGII